MNPEARRVSLILAAFAGGFFLLYLAGTSAVYTYADDSLPFAVQVHSDHRINVHHLILTILHWLNQWLGFTTLGDFPKTVWLFKTYVAASAGLALWLVGEAARRWFGSLAVAVVSMLAVGLTYGFWSYAIVPDVYVPAVAFSLLAVYWASRSFEPAAWGEGYGYLALSAGAILLASLNHQSHSLVVFPIALVLALWRDGKISCQRRLIRAATFLCGTALLGLVTYYGAYRAAGTEESFVRFVRGYSTWMQMMPYDKVQALTPLYAGLGVARALTFPECWLHFDSLYARAHEMFPLKLLFDEKYLLRNFPDSAVLGMGTLVILINVVAAGATGAAIWKAIQAPPKEPGFWMLAGWVPLQALFFAWWEPTSNEFWIWLLPCLGAMVPGLLLRRPGGGGRRWLAWLFVLALLAANLPVVSRYWSAKNCIFHVNKTYLPKLATNDLAVTAYFYPSSYLKYLEGRLPNEVQLKVGAVTMHNPELQSKLAAVESTGGRVFLDPILVMPEDTELRLLPYQAHYPPAEAAAGLLALEKHCEVKRIPLFGVARKGAPVIRFEKREFGGYLRWVDAELGSLDAEVPGE